MKRLIKDLWEFMDEELGEQDLRLAFETIQFIQHERLVHLLVTIFTFAGFLFFGIFYLLTDVGGTMLLDLVLLVLLLCYIHYYRFLENNVQGLYERYIELYEEHVCEMKTVNNEA